MPNMSPGLPLVRGVWRDVHAHQRPLQCMPRRRATPKVEVRHEEQALADIPLAPVDADAAHLT